MPETTLQPRQLVLHLLRHAHAGDRMDWDGDDDLRPLSRKGRRQSERLGEFLDAHGVRPDVIVTSPRTRAAQTAEAVGEALKLHPIVDPRVGDLADLASLEAVLADYPGSGVMLVGHDPDFSWLLSQLCGAGDLQMRKGALASMDIVLPLHAASALLRWLIPPELLEGS